jgi:hypothetical protein
VAGETSLFETCAEPSAPRPHRAAALTRSNPPRSGDRGGSDRGTFPPLTLCSRSRQSSAVSSPDCYDIVNHARKRQRDVAMPSTIRGDVTALSRSPFPSRSTKRSCCELGARRLPRISTVRVRQPRAVVCQLRDSRVRGARLQGYFSVLYAVRACSHPSRMTCSV